MRRGHQKRQMMPLTDSFRQLRAAVRGKGQGHEMGEGQVPVKLSGNSPSKQIAPTGHSSAAANHCTSAQGLAQGAIT